LATLRPDIAAQWHPTLNGDLTPNDVVCGSTKKFWWLCENGHKFQLSVLRISGLRKSCKECNSLSFLRPDIAAQWHPTKNGRLTAKGISHGSEKKVWWVCEKGHEWESTVYNRTNGNGCEKCSKSSISEVSQEWLDSLGIPEENREITLQDLKMRVDAFVPEINTVYEFFGDYWHGNPDRFDLEDFNKHNGKTFGELYEETKTRVIRLRKAGYKIIYIWENDFYLQNKVESS